MATILKVSVLADGGLLLDGRPVTMAELSEAMDRGGEVVWYYRENAAGAPPPVALEVMKLITERRLPVRLSSRPDFSDAVGPDASATLAKAFAAIRARAARRQLVILRPDGKTMILPAMARESAPAEAIAAMERLLPSATPRNVAVIAETAWAAAENASLQDAARAIPFFGLLMGLAAIGHAVWIFQGGNAAMIGAGCQDADLAIVDSGRLESLPPGWQDAAGAGMRSRLIMVHERETNRLRKA